MTKRFKIWLAVSLIGVFVAGFASGLLAGAVHARHVFFGRHHHGFAGDRFRDHLKRELQLTPEQNQQVEPILERLGDQLDTIRAETRRRVGDAMAQSHRQIVPLLTPEQQEKLQGMRRRHHHMMRMRGEKPPDEP